ncbi:TPR domain protein, putative component of TonB system [hydrothermal vent metagenome]|uniref:protein O-GlcNAc transferase n=1 Tax=hydrothermal vent metagenome TaxID=652676 RepID=A0A3B0YIG8_9ZZZZ
MNKLLQAKKKKALEHYRQGNLEAAKKNIIPVCKKAKRDAESWYLYGLILANQSQPAEAVEVFEKVINLGDSNSYSRDASVNLGVALSALKKYSRSRNILEQVVTRYPGEVDAYINLVISCIKLKDHAKAFDYAQRAIKLAPERAMAQQNFGAICSILEKYDMAEQAFEAAIKLNRHEVEAYVSYARMLAHAKKYARAEKMCRTVLVMKPNEMRTISALIKYKIEQGMLSDALQEYRQLMDEGVLKVEDAVAYLLDIQYDYHSTPESIFDAHQRWGLAHAAAAKKQTDHYSTQDNQSSEYQFAIRSERASGENKLKIAYISPDFRGHSVSYFIKAILQYHNRELFEVHCFVYLDSEDETTETLRSLSDFWHDVTLLNSPEIVSLIRSKNIDIAVDLAGHTRKSLLYVLSDRVAPLQFSYLGYPSTTGMSNIDYRLVDNVTDPEGYDQYATEALLRIPESFLCYSNKNILVIREDKEDDNNSIVFASFNNLAKINEYVVEVWSKVLHKVKNSRLLLKNKSFKDLAVRERYVHLFEKSGIDASRLEFVGFLKDTNAHMQLYAKADIALDTFPYNGTTTSCEAMWMGVPVVTLCGDRHSSRVGSSLLHAIGVEEWVANTEEEFVKIAVDLAANKPQLEIIKSGLRQKMQGSVLCDGPGFTSKLEAIYQDRYQQLIFDR